MILPDINLLVYAYNRHAPHHVCGFVRLMTHPAVLVDPLDPGRTLLHVRSWVERPLVEVLEPGPRHLEIFERLLESLGVAANLTTDAHLAAIAIEHQCELHSNDADFTRFAGLRWRNPL